MMPETTVYQFHIDETETVPIELTYTVSGESRTGPRTSLDESFSGNGRTVEIIGHKLVGPYSGDFLNDFRSTYRKSWAFSEYVDDMLAELAR